MVQVNSAPIVLRVKFFKRGALQYISHLDLVRTMMKVIVRADLPLWYTMGFNPKPKVVFAAPLSIGTESECEYMDVRLTERMSEEEALCRLNANMASDMQALECYYPETKLTDLKWLSYEMIIDTKGDANENAERCCAALRADVLEITKKGKSGEEKTVDIKPLIKFFDVNAEDGKIKLDLVLSAEQSQFLNPEHVVKLLRKEAGILSAEDITSEGYSIKRKTAYFDDMRPFC